MKEELAAGLREGQVAELIEDNKIHAGEIFGEAALAAGAGRRSAGRNNLWVMERFTERLR